MILNHRRCGGPVFVDRLYPQDKRVELFCLICGTRWFLPRHKGNAFTEWLSTREKLGQGAMASFS